MTSTGNRPDRDSTTVRMTNRIGSGIRALARRVRRDAPAVWPTLRQWARYRSVQLAAMLAVGLVLGGSAVAIAERAAMLILGVLLGGGVVATILHMTHRPSATASHRVPGQDEF